MQAVRAERAYTVHVGKQRIYELAHIINTCENLHTWAFKGHESGLLADI